MNLVILLFQLCEIIGVLANCSHALQMKDDGRNLCERPSKVVIFYYI